MLGKTAIFVAALGLLSACGSDDSPAGGTGGAAGTAGSGGSGGGSASCQPDPLKTGLVAQQTGVSVDAFDCEILEWTAKQNEPDAMLFKAIIYVESRFDQLAVACPNEPCGVPNGWTSAETGCYGLMQIVPACGPPDDLGLLPNGHPNLEQSSSASGWAGSVFNPAINIQLGIAGIADNRAQEKQKFSGCTEDQYTMMAIGDYNSYGSTKSCTVYNTDYTSIVLDAYQEYSTAAGWTPHPY